ncbi:MAG: class III poly(R)-hydroxyalkanoic acid synthase subunit PhaC [Syntrophomonadaceae bacterium]|jgi:polyhydroxyalkanoate synthase
MKKIEVLTGSAEEVGKMLQSTQERMMRSTQRWVEVLNLDPLPETGMTPKDIVWRKNKTKLYRYVSPNGYKYKTPLLMLYALINKPYILDLVPGMSLVEHLVNEGFDVYLLDWGEFSWEDRNLSFSDLIHDYIARAVQKVCQFSESDELSILGYCMGGTMASMYAALFPQPAIKNLVYLAVPTDFGDAGVSSIWLAGTVFDVDKVTDTFELIPKEFIDFGVKLLNPVNNFVSTYTRLWKNIDEGLPIAAWKALDKWVNDNVNFPGRAYKQWIKDFYQENLLVKGEFVIKGRKVKLSNISANMLLLIGEHDHIVIPHQSKAILDHISSQDKTCYEFKVGHGGLVFGSLAKREVFPVICNWLGERSV